MNHRYGEKDKELMELVEEGTALLHQLHQFLNQKSLRTLMSMTPDKSR
jgi:hypothetical protein